MVAGLQERDFWQMDPGEITRYLKAYAERRKLDLQTQATMLYTLSNLIGMSVGRLFSKSQTFPTLEQSFPSLFDYDPERERMERSVANFRAFADRFNAKRSVKDGNTGNNQRPADS